jgi:hypothetical protein
MAKAKDLDGAQVGQLVPGGEVSAASVIDADCRLVAVAA